MIFESSPVLLVVADSKFDLLLSLFTDHVTSRSIRLLFLSTNCKYKSFDVPAPIVSSPSGMIFAVYSGSATVTFTESSNPKLLFGSNIFGIISKLALIGNVLPTL